MSCLGQGFEVEEPLGPQWVNLGTMVEVWVLKQCMYKTIIYSNFLTNSTPRKMKKVCTRVWWKCRQYLRHHQPDSPNSGTTRTSKVPRPIFTQVCRQKLLISSRCSTVQAQMLRKKEMEAIMGKMISSHWLLGSKKRKRLAPEGWRTCQWVIVVFNVAPFQVLKGFSIFGFHFYNTFGKEPAAMSCAYKDFIVFKNLRKKEKYSKFTL